MIFDQFFKKRFLAFISIICCLIFTSCEYEQRVPLDMGSLPEVVSFSADVIPLFEQNCTSCHGGDISPDLRAENAYFDLTSGNYIDTDNPENSLLYQEISGSGQMEQYASDYQRAIVLKWIEQGADDN